MQKKYGNQDEDDRKEIMNFFDFKEVNKEAKKKKTDEPKFYKATEQEKAKS